MKKITNTRNLPIIAVTIYLYALNYAAYSQSFSGPTFNVNEDQLILNNDRSKNSLHENGSGITSGIRFTGRYGSWNISNFDMHTLTWYYDNPSLPLKKLMSIDSNSHLSIYGNLESTIPMLKLWKGTTNVLGVAYNTEGTEERIGFADGNFKFLAYSTYNSTPSNAKFVIPQGSLHVPIGNVGIGLSTNIIPSKLTIGNAPNNGNGFNLRSYGTGATWNGSAAFGGSSKNVVIGELSGSATIGGHNASLDGWADLLINKGGGNVGIGIDIPTAKLDVNGKINSTGYSLNGIDIEFSQWVTINNNIKYTSGNVGIGVSSNNFPSKLTVGAAPNNGRAFNFRSYSNSSTVWNGSGAFGGDKKNVVIGELNGFATIGGHNDTLNEWEDLILNQEGGNVGIGLRTPTDKLDVNGRINSTGYRLNGEDVTFSKWNLVENNINYTNGNVGIGLASPTNKLDVSGIINGTGYKLDGVDVAFSQWITSNNNISYSTGNVGIGIASPTNKLDVSGVINSTGYKINGVDVAFSQWITNNNNISYSTGNVGIGTSTPSAMVEIGVGNVTNTKNLLKVNGGATFNNTLSDAENRLLTTQVSINTNKKIKNAALTVAGTTFIGSWGELEALDTTAGNNSNDEIVNGIMDDSHYNDYNLWVTKGIVSEDYAITSKDTWADNVFKKEYKLPSLKEIEDFIKLNKHLPGVLNEYEVKKKGYNLHEMNVAFLEKIENLYLYTIEQSKKLEEQEKELSQERSINIIQEKKLNTLQNELEMLKSALLLIKN